ncbi:MFS transporter [Acidipropionibacterium thoenii]|uniref:MFS transporter n=1 Tax=Acidipropionibacterium thoenii TaxID=1751 RepID=UPI000486D8FE|nr:MFS transporter [Acidipropionibacterium thoenii]
MLGWALWDPGTQPYASVITTFVFSVYIVSDSFGSNDLTSTSLSWTMALAGLLIALLAPVAGQWADRRGRRISLLKWLSWALAVMAGALFFVQAKASFLVLGLILLGVGTVISDVASSIYNGLLDDVAEPSKVGRISGLGWGLGYVGGILALLVIYIGWIKPTIGWFGVSSANGMDIRVSMLFCGAWILLLTLPTFIILRDPPSAPRAAGEAPGSLWASYVELGHSIARLWRDHRPIMVFLIASALFRDGLNGVFQFGGPIAKQTFGFSSSEVLIFGIAANLVAGVATIAFGLLDDRIGPRRVIILSLVVLIIAGVAVFVLHGGGPMVFWIVGMAMCAFVGPAQSASRSYLARVCPAGMEGEVFGLYATTGKAVSFLAPLMFGIFITTGHLLSGGDNNQYWGILGIVVVLLAGLLAMIPVGEAVRPDGE